MLSDWRPLVKRRRRYYSLTAQQQAAVDAVEQSLASEDMRWRFRLRVAGRIQLAGSHFIIDARLSAIMANTLAEVAT
jgi:hypothetical protein